MDIEIDREHILKYLKPFGAVKIVEILCLMIAWATLAGGLKGESNVVSSVCMAMWIISWLFAIAWFIMKVWKLFSKLKIPSKPIVFGVIHIVLGALVIISGTILAVILLFCPSGGCGIFHAATAFAIISGIILIADGILHIYVEKKSRDGGGNTALHQSMLA